MKANFKSNFIKNLLKGSSKISKKENKTSVFYQKKLLKYILLRTKDTEFGKKFRFNKIALSEDYTKTFQRFVPIYDYDTIYKEWWSKMIEGKEDICFPGIIKNFALSSGTSGSASKKIPVSNAQLKRIRRASIKQLKFLHKYQFNKEFYNSSVLGIGGCTKLDKIDNYYQGDLSGIISLNVPKYFTKFYLPNKEISDIANWDEKLDKIVDEAINWNIGIIAGVPSWIQILFDKILNKYNLKNIHEIWPNLNVFVHGGVHFEPYKQQFEKYLGKKLVYMETYLASEGFFAISDGDSPLKLLVNNGTFYEFIPFNETNFDDEGNLVSFPEVLTIENVKENVDYALLITTISGAWRYLIGDTLKFLSKEKNEIVITGRTKYFLSICGEHLSADNMNEAINMICKNRSISIPEFCVYAEQNELNNNFHHHWFISTDDSSIDKNLLILDLDKNLCELNDDYKTERKSALSDIYIDVIDSNYFFEFIKESRNLGAQTKFPRVLKGELKEKWKLFINTKYKNNQL